MRRSICLWTALLAAVMAAPVSAAPCKTPRQLKLEWHGNSGKGLLNFVAYDCALPASCPVERGTTATKMPLNVTLREGDKTIFQANIQTCDKPKCASFNAGGCKGGGDSHKSSAGLVKLAYPTKGTTSATVRIRGAMNRPPAVTGPVTVTLTDASGYSLEATYTKCRSGVGTSSVTIACR